MEASVSAETSKRHENEDRISHLPDHILHYILSFLPTKFAVGTSILSTRWRFLWTSVHNLDFCDMLLFSKATTKKDYLKRKRPFINFVDRVLFLQGKNVSNVHKFSLTCQDCDAVHFNKWVSNAIKRKVQELILSITKEHPSVFPHCLFTCESLSTLKIKMTVYVAVPSSICFSLLKVLHLTYIKFFSDQSSVQEVSLNLPILEELAFYNCAWLKIKTVNIVVPTLQVLKIECWSINGSHDCEIKIDAESLISLKLEVCTSYKYSLLHLSSLVDSSIKLPSCHRIHNDTTIDRLGSLLGAIYNVRNLELNVESIESISSPVFSARMHSLSRLVHLTVLRGSCSTGKKFINMLCDMLYIETLVLPDGLCSYDFSGDGRILGTTPRCFLSHLKLVDIKDFRGINSELWFVKFLVKSVKEVDKLRIRLTRPRSETRVNWKEQIIEKLDKYVKSSNCVLELI
ncbi:hypothetical protein IFM89_033853 [Coptis chinensis]|uniref:FBD domain-containing protein n=1 Tax=Coptis chinensis TaxID=261450 RepID=A0A835HZM8_9MAGN|nr:hypothetical protein IFM89_033853 [Coptis chinensis]